MGIQWEMYTMFTSELCIRIQHSLVNIISGYNIHYTVNIVWDTVSTDSYGGTIFPWGGERGRYSLVHNICGV